MMQYEAWERRSSGLSQSSQSGFSSLTPTRTMGSEDFDTIRGPTGLRTLNDFEDPYVETVLVHGLLGDSNLTWTNEADKEAFWPAWLADDIELCKMRTHTYGYHEPLIGGKAAVSRLRDIGIALCAALEANSQIRASYNTPIVFIAHSLGGLVVKAAIEHAKSNPKLHELGRRIHAVLFLATPHKDAEDRHMLRDLLQACNTSHALRFIEPEPSSSVLRDINSNFVAYAQELKISNFYEGNADPIVDKRRATLGLSHESPVRVNADHAGVSQYRDPFDPTYCSIREILLGMVTDLHDELHSPEKVGGHMRTLATYLGIDDSEDEELARRERVKVPGSCEWLLHKPDFIQWRDQDGLRNAKRPQVYWLNGDPGCGKSYLTTHVITHLKNRGCATSFYYFKHGDLSKQSIGGLLKSIAWQMASTSAAVRRSLLSMQQEDLIAEQSDLRAVWKQLFVQRIFTVAAEHHQFWVIDALDEAKGSLALFALLQSLPVGYSVFVTSRRDRDLVREVLLLGMSVFTQEVEKEDTMDDLRTYLEHRGDDLHVDDDAEKQILIQKMLEKSKGSFLWTSLTLTQLTNFWTDEDIDNSLNDVPEGMQQLYSRILLKIAATANGSLARAILRWVVCAIRPMTVSEIRTAVRHDTGQVLKKSAQAIKSICEPLVSVNNDRVEVVHDTVREYFFNKDRKRRSSPDVLSQYLFDRASSHEQLATICVNYLSRGSKASPRKLYHDRTGSTAADEDPFRSYASQNFSEHVAKSAVAEESDSTHKMVMSLLEFFLTSFLSWIQHLAETNNLSILTRCGKNLKAFVARRMTTSTRLGLQLQEIQDWADDVIHLVTAFGKDLYKDPSAIHSVIVPLCPSQSKIFSELRDPDNGLQVVGLSRGSWPDKISSSSFGGDYANGAQQVNSTMHDTHADTVTLLLVALACNEKLYAVGLRSQTVVLYYGTTCQEARRIKTVESIKRLQFAHGKDWLLASGRRTLTMYNHETGEGIWTIPTKDEIFAMAMSSDNQCIFAVTREKDVKIFDVKTDDLISSRQPPRSQAHKSPLQVHISEDMGLIAVIHRHDALELFDLDTLQPLKGRISYSANLETIAFNRALNMLATASFDGEICTYDLSSSMRRMQKMEADASHMAVSADGKTLLVGTKDGDIQIHDFESLTLLHKIRYHEEEFVGLCFASNSLRFLDIRRQTFNVWEPAALVRRIDDIDDTNSEGRTAYYSTTLTHPSQTSGKSDQSPITSICEHHSGDFVFCAKENGTISVYDTLLGRAIELLLEYGRTEVLFMAWNPARHLLASADNSSTVRVHQVRLVTESHVASSRKSWQVMKVLERPIQQPIRQVLLSEDGEFLLVSTTVNDHVYSTNGDSQALLCEHTHCPTTAEQPQKWATHSLRKHEFLEIEKEGSQVISWSHEDLKPRVEVLGRSEVFNENSPTAPGTNVQLVPLGTQLWGAYDNNPNTAPVIWEQTTPTSSLLGLAAIQMMAQTMGAFAKIAPQMECILGMYEGRLVFLGVDNWICSINTYRTRLDDPVKHHLPMPHYWRSDSRRRQGLVTGKGDIVIVVEGDLAIVKNAW